MLCEPSGGPRNSLVSATHPFLSEGTTLNRGSMRSCVEPVRIAIDWRASQAHARSHGAKIGRLLSPGRHREQLRKRPLADRRRGGRKRALGTRAPLTLPQGPNQRWSLDFVSDTLTAGRRFRILALVDDFRAHTQLSGLARASKVSYRKRIETGTMAYIVRFCSV